MTPNESFSNSTYEEETHMADIELSAFLFAVKQAFGAEQAMLSAKDWLDESELMDSPPLSIDRNWRAVMIAASARLANRMCGSVHRLEPNCDG